MTKKAMLTKTNFILKMQVLLLNPPKLNLNFRINFNDHCIINSVSYNYFRSTRPDI